MKQLDRDVTLQLGVAAEIDRAVTAFAERPQQTEPAPTPGRIEGTRIDLRDGLGVRIAGWGSDL